MTDADLQTAIPTSALISLELRARIFDLAKKRGQSVSSMLRPVVIAALDKSDLPNDVPQELGVPISVRLPIAVRQKLKEAAKKRGTSVSVLLASIVSSRLTMIGDAQC
ncbi:hypothetical protein D4A92_19590 [Rhizobium rosettiformans]|uniref:Ribbon-helix-helix protein, CopG family n=1 Tax=Rhizobium rosettiformans TaxID=1368430 RepID=A0ABX7EYU8_9HYPH|nr:hypothetical protein [Rhizobium rosettiformans]QRF53490.1 hypothetical protein D4A92_19590 [Rhizobium rosettiformans]